MYAGGAGVAQDDSQAVRWWKQAAEQGDASAQFNLGLAYRDGRGLPQDYSEALMWLMVAAQRMSGADKEKGTDVRDALARKLSPSQVAGAEKLARERLKTFESRKP